ncbi:DUF2092 domain-containing protein [Mesorhizobium sophorae]|uniref:DUF2092 domain-containing protein n=1 Tax=Mesorhizobium sophorae TaxID=1300294 RepID=UPI000BA3A8FA|nr:DUF2092 domain-containing protein [Mesorhizobium sophorae]
MQTAAAVLASKVVYDGTPFSVLGKNLNAYARIEAKGTIDELTYRLADAGVEAPGGEISCLPTSSRGWWMASPTPSISRAQW